MMVLSLSFACVALLVFCAPPFYVVWLCVIGGNF